MLIFGSHIGRPTTAGRPCRNATNEVEPFLIRPPEIIGDRLTKVIAIGEWLTRDFCHATIDGFDLGTQEASAVNSLPIAVEFRFEQVVDLLGLRAAYARLDPITRFT